VDPVLRKAGRAPEALDPIAPHQPASGLVDVDAAGVAAVANVGAPFVGQLDEAALNGPGVGVTVIGGVDLDRLLPGVDDAQVVEHDPGDGMAGRAADVDRVVPRPGEGQVRDDHPGSVDADQLAGAVVAVEDHGLTIAPGRTQGHLGSVEAEPAGGVAVGHVVDAVVEQDGGPAGCTGDDGAELIRLAWMDLDSRAGGRGKRRTRLLCPRRSGHARADGDHEEADARAGVHVTLLSLANRALRILNAKVSSKQNAVR